MSTQSLSLDGKIALVTGGSRGIGRAVVKLLAARGAAVALTYGKSADAADDLVKEVERAGGRALAVRANAADKAAVGAAVERAVGEFGRLDILVNNAGVAKAGTLAEMADEDFEWLLDVNVRGVWHTTKAALAHLNDGGRVVIVGSAVGERIPFPGSSAYGMTKHAVVGLTKGWARDLAGRKITVNAVEPGPIDTDLNPDTPDNAGAEQMKQMVPLARYGRAEEVAELVAFLASDAAAYITGAHVTIDGGMMA